MAIAEYLKPQLLGITHFLEDTGDVTCGVNRLSVDVDVAQNVSHIQSQLRKQADGIEINDAETSIR